ncbi:hypothetical protein B4065_1954 [Caldibacillus thermoamylovorans]|uniref:DUF1819 domain-containing protein n=1 Tax=Caldibacillus thermoamylovorans TaxID=35841 RepID=A0ABD4ACX6_9BACI|nr:DUF1819 family protein [Caldibacillus thermoamylovorans]KIO67256.1 hypothetical protein B4065_1954 [Caldibacillus thermoamylovorans]KIO67262.1 hypothetical protein B4166_2428 [Caldibacillus thermoamylovorans]KIO74295.1 hypothetical protein B4167_1518 [Caldibacillus thermoamylovorans]
MESDNKYTTTLNGAQFLLYEFSQIVKLKEQGLTDEEIKEKVIDENILQQEKVSSLKRRLRYLLPRVNVLDETLRCFVIHESIDISKVINFYSILKTDRLFYEFMNEVIKEKFKSNNYNLEKKDLNAFFTYKAEQNDTLKSWSDSTIQRLKQVYMRMLEEVGILTDRKTGELRRLIIDDQLKSHLRSIGDGQYIELMGDQ